MCRRATHVSDSLLTTCNSYISVISPNCAPDSLSLYSRLRHSLLRNSVDYAFNHILLDQFSTSQNACLHSISGVLGLRGHGGLVILSEIQHLRPLPCTKPQTSFPGFRRSFHIPTPYPPIESGSTLSGFPTYHIPIPTGISYAGGVSRGTGIGSGPTGTAPGLPPFATAGQSSPDYSPTGINSGHGGQYTESGWFYVPPKTITETVALYTVTPSPISSGRHPYGTRT